MIPKRLSIGYGLGDLANNLLFQLSVLYLLFFYTDIARIPAGAAAIIFLAARIWDAVNDPLMGLLVDNTRSKHGKARVYIKNGALPLSLATVLLFFIPAGSVVLRIGYAAATYLIWGMLYTLVSIPYASMTAQLSSDPDERTKLSAVRMLFMLLGVIIVAVATEPLVSLFANQSAGYLFTVVLYAVIAMAAYLLCFWATASLAGAKAVGTADAERGRTELTRAAELVDRNRGTLPESAASPTKQQPQQSKAQTIAAQLFLLFSNTPALILSGAFLLGATAEYMREAAVIYFVSYNMGDASLMSVFMGVVVLSMVVGNILIPKAVSKFDKKPTYMIGSLIAIVGSLIFHFISHDNLALVLGAAAFSSLGFTVVSTLGWAMLPDTVEYGQQKNGLRNEGSIYSLFSFSQKLATALAGGIVALVLQLSSYEPGVAAQKASALLGILSTITLIPIGLLVLSMIILNFYPISRNKYREILDSMGNAD